MYKKHVLPPFGEGKSAAVSSYYLLSLAAAFLITFLMPAAYAQRPAATSGIGYRYPKELWKADSMRDSYAYTKALKAYQNLYERDPGSALLQLRIAESYRLLGDSKKAVTWYRQMIHDSISRPIDNFHYAQMLCLEGLYNQSKHYFDMYRSKVAEGYDEAQAKVSPSNLPFLTADTSSYVVERLPINSLGADFSPAKFNQGLVYVSALGSDLNIHAKRKEGKSSRAYFDLYFSQLDHDEANPPEPFSDAINSKLHEGPLVFFDSARQVIFTRNHSYPESVSEKERKRDKHFGMLRMYTSHLEKHEKTGKWHWSRPKMLPFSNLKTSYGHPATKDGKTLYLVSDKASGAGNTDLYVSYLKEGKWTKPISLGPLVNTKGNELFPFLGKDGMLYFSSDGLGGIGGLDIYRFDPNSDEKPVNLGYPINTEYDDFGIIIEDSLTLSGYLSSNRARGHDDDDIYRFYRIENDSLYHLADSMAAIMVAVHELDIIPSRGTSPIRPTVSSKDMLIMVGSGKKARLFKEDESGRYLMPYLGSGIDSEGRSKATTRINNVYFDFNKTNITPIAAHELDKLANVMKAYSNVSVEADAYADSRGKSDFNQRLSSRRGAAVAGYLLKKGIDKKRVMEKAYGERNPVNPCSDQDAPCTESQYRLNRRVEFSFILKDSKEIPLEGSGAARDPKGALRPGSSLSEKSKPQEYVAEKHETTSEKNDQYRINSAKKNKTTSNKRNNSQTNPTKKRAR